MVAVTMPVVVADVHASATWADRDADVARGIDVPGAVGIVVPDSDSHSNPNADPDADPEAGTVGAVGVSMRVAGSAVVAVDGSGTTRSMVSVRTGRLASVV